MCCTENNSFLHLIIITLPFLNNFFLQLTHQLAEMQRLQKTAEATVRQLRVDLSLAQKELLAAQARDKTRNESDDSKIKGFLQKIAKLDEELAAAKLV